MALHDFDELFEHYPETIPQMRPVFNSHEFILKPAQENQRSYVEALYTYRENGAPFQAVHQRLSDMLNSCGNLIEPHGNAASHDIFGKPNGRKQWRKLG